jgi:fatty-acid desaturase
VKSAKWMFAVVLALCLAMSGVAWAQDHGKGHGKGHEKHDDNDDQGEYYKDHDRA